ncbi:sugar phosphate isomerase/epimerase family protein [Cohaesibacter celericrescens]|uniref:sugar phosphate isomerase/epimerase family protein n=1 Tax=Cohaesibacter celericrescens TaxID=2067669 RepID=UPI0035684253
MTLKLSFCNEMLAAEGIDLDGQAARAAALGYMGLELAPFTLSEQPHLLTKQDAFTIKATLQGHNIAVTGLHWLLSAYPELSITNTQVKRETISVLLALVRLNAHLGGSVMVHGSPAQRKLRGDEDKKQLNAHVAELFKPVAALCEELDIVYCIEPLSPIETSFINRVEEAVELCDLIGSSHFRTMIDTSASAQSEDMPVADLIDHWLPTGWIGHIQLNDSNRGTPGSGQDPFKEIITAIKRQGWSKPMAIEPFVSTIDATTTAALGAGLIRGLWDAST